MNATFINRMEEGSETLDVAVVVTINLSQRSDSDNW